MIVTRVDTPGTPTLEVLDDSDGIVAALAIDQRNALRSLFARSERRSGMCFGTSLQRLETR